MAQLLPVLILAITFANVLNGVVSSKPAPSEPLSAFQARSSRQQDQNRTCIITMRQTTEEILARVASMTFQSREDRINYMVNTLEAFTIDTQRPILSFLTRILGTGAFESLWIANQIILRSCNNQLVRQLLRFRQVGSVSDDQEFPLEPREGTTEDSDGNGNSNDTIPWGIKRVGAPEAHAAGYNGSGIVVANIDTGVRYTHEALRGNFRQNYGWYDPVNGSDMPSDDDGHGTHTMGTAVGRGGIGVAPGATWIACKGCPSSSCLQSALAQCLQWCMCPTAPDGSSRSCAMAPDVVSNSWHGGNDTFRLYTMALDTAGIIPVFAIGNTGPNCNTKNQPGSFENVIGVGSATINGTISIFSSVGSSNGTTKPDVSAPGSDIRSAYHTSDSAYAVLSGTSMACPHVAGLVALMLQKNPNLGTAQVKAILQKTAVPVDTRNRTECGPHTGEKIPNCYQGYGLVNCPSTLKSTPNRNTTVNLGGNSTNFSGNGGGNRPRPYKLGV